MQVQEILTVYSNFQKVSGLKVNIVKTTILGINTPRQRINGIAELTGITVVTSLGIWDYKSKHLMPSPEQPHTRQCMPATQIRSYQLLLCGFFHRWQLIQQVLLNSFNHIFMAFGHDQQWGEEIDKMIIKLLWTKKREGQVHRGRTLIAKKTAYYEFYLWWTQSFLS